jgi:CDGSH-type Zn-finger protein
MLRLISNAHECTRRNRVSDGVEEYRGKEIVVRFDDGPRETAPPVNVVRIRENGPLAFHAELVIEGEQPAFRATLCRCGASRRKPYCDGSHAAAQFASTGEPATQESSPLAARDGALAVKPIRNGPLMIGGPLEIVSGTGRTVTRVTETFLCRCGSSANKPFCDGSHKRIGFEADGTERAKKPAAP